MIKRRIILLVAIFVIITTSIVIQGFSTENEFNYNIIVKTDEYNNVTLLWEKTNSLKNRR